MPEAKPEFAKTVIVKALNKTRSNLVARRDKLNESIAVLDIELENYV